MVNYPQLEPPNPGGTVLRLLLRGELKTWATRKRGLWEMLNAISEEALLTWLLGCDCRRV